MVKSNFVKEHCNRCSWRMIPRFVIMGTTDDPASNARFFFNRVSMEGSSSKEEHHQLPTIKGPNRIHAVGVRDCQTGSAMSWPLEPLSERLFSCGSRAGSRKTKIGTVVVDLNELRSQASTTLELAEHVVSPVHYDGTGSKSPLACSFQKALRSEPTS